MAITAMTTVPRNTGTAPKEPWPATWSLRMAICGSQFRPNRNSYQGTLARSEEHTSELQSLMRISYAVFCLKKKNKRTKYDVNRTLTTATNIKINKLETSR